MKWFCKMTCPYSKPEAVPDLAVAQTLKHAALRKLFVVGRLHEPVVPGSEGLDLQPEF